mmetsp:Transcript_22994/g.19959  ORF Transcript_22994/g.19959 Transcript_22994/m.19959 type:complete len:103 (-) Transcript_22994:114-422(-)
MIIAAMIPELKNFCSFVEKDGTMVVNTPLKRKNRRQGTRRVTRNLSVKSPVGNSVGSSKTPVRSSDRRHSKYFDYGLKPVNSPNKKKKGDTQDFGISVDQNN